MARIIEFTEKEALARARRRSCILKLILVWFGIMGVVIIAMIFVRSRVNRDPDAIMEQVTALVEMELPPGFQAYSMSRFMGVKLYSFWDRQQLRPDGRTTSVIAVYTEDAWRDWELAKVRDTVLPELEDRLDRNEFRTQEKTEERISSADGEIMIYRFSGVQRLEDQFVEATTCYRFLKGPRGPLQIHSIGLNESFGPESQIRFLASVKAR